MNVGDIIGIRINATDDLNVYLNQINDLVSSDSRVIGSYIIDSDNLNFSSNSLNEFHAQGTGFDFTNAKATYGIIIVDSIQLILNGNNFTSFTSNSNVFGLSVTSSQQGTITNNNILDYSGDTIFGIDLTSLSSGSSITNNTIDDLSGDVITGIHTASENIKIIGNNISNSQSNTQSWILDIVNGSDSEVANNRIMHHFSGSIHRDVYGMKIRASSNVIVQNNRLENISAPVINIYGISLEKADDSVVEKNTIKDISSTSKQGTAIQIIDTKFVSVASNSIRSIHGYISTNSHSSIIIDTVNEAAFGINLITTINITIQNNNFSEVANWIDIDETNNNTIYSDNRLNDYIIYLTAINRPVDMIIGYDDTGEIVFWTAYTDPNNQTKEFEIYLNGELAANDSWVSGFAIAFPLTNLTDGNNLIEIFLTQVNNITHYDSMIVFVTETTIPIISTYEENIRMVRGDEEKMLSWTVTDVNPGSYNLLQDGGSKASTTWESNIPITYPLDHLDIGVYNFTLVVEDNTGNSASDSVMVTVLEAFDIYFSIIPNDLSFNFNETTSLIWQVESIESGNYIIVQNEEAITSGEWDPGEPIIYDIIDLEIGYYIFSIEIIDDLGNLLEDEVIVEVKELVTTKTTEDDDPFAFLTLAGDTDLSAIEENPWAFALFASALSAGVVSIYLRTYRRKRNLFRAKEEIKTSKKSTTKKSTSKKKSSTKKKS
jgi:hypothetical protein